MSDHVSPTTSRLDAHGDARLLVRLVQCSRCSRPFRAPVTLPCGNAVCRSCLPAPHTRSDITYPATPDRQKGIRCPIEACAADHPLGECNVDVTFSKIMESVEETVTTAASMASDDSTLLLETSISSKEKDSTEEKQNEKETRQLRTHRFSGGRLLATYMLAAQGQLPYAAEITYRNPSSAEGSYADLDASLLSALREAAAEKLECSVCYNIMYEPVTASCGHTFCRICLARTLDHTQHCPWCRQSLPMAPSLGLHPNNVHLTALLQTLCPETVAARAEAVAEEMGIGDLNVPLFVCSLAYPGMPTFLHVFEPRYRLMIRRATQGNGRFGMLMYNASRQPQGQLGPTIFMQYGTMLQIIGVHMLPDGRSLIESKGIGRFRVLEHGMLDGYHVGRVERVEDVSLAEEERQEAQDLAAANAGTDGNGINNNGTGDPVINTATAPLNTLSTVQLHTIGLEFIMCMQRTSASWLHERIIDAYGGPPEDPALFPYWFATVLPIAETEKYQLLRAVSVRHRLKIVVRWIRAMQQQTW